MHSQHCGRKSTFQADAWRHGLAAAPDGKKAEQVEKLGAELAAEFSQSSRALVREVAQAEVDLLRVRRVQMTILDGGSCGGTHEQPVAESNSIAQLERMDRYEKRVLSKRMKALRVHIRGRRVI